MHIVNKSNSSLNKEYLGLPKQIEEIANKLYNVINHSYELSGGCLSIRINERNFTIRDIWWECVEKLKNLEKGGTKTEFLAMSVLEDAFRKALPLLLVSVKDIADGDFSQPDAVNALRTIFSENEYTKLWAEKSKTYCKIIESLGLTLEYADYEDLTGIMEPLLNALSFYEGADYYQSKPTINQVRKGEVSKKQPKTATTICKYTSVKEYVDALELCEEESIISFGAVEQTEGACMDYFYAYMTDGELLDERTRNGMRNKKISLKEYQALPNKHSRAVYLGVKNKDNIWLIHMPYRTESFRAYEDSSDKYYYGKRAGYAPYEIFFHDIKAQPEGTTFLAIKNQGYRLNDIMDDMQKIWLPVFLEETRKVFFSDNIPSADKEILLPEEVTARTNDGKNEIAPCFGPPSIRKSYCFLIPSPEVVFEEDELTKELIQYFHITAEDITDAPLLANKIGTKEQTEAYLLENVKKSYIKALATHISILLEGLWPLRDEIVDFIDLHKGAILQKAKEGIFTQITDIIIDGEPLTDKEGNVKTEKKWKNGEWAQVPIIEKNSTEDGRIWRSKALRDCFHNFTIWAGEQTSSGKPPVLLVIKPSTAAEYATLLPEYICESPIIRYAEHIRHFEEEYGNNLRRSISDRYPRRDRPTKGNIHIPSLSHIYICLKKSEYKKWVKDKKTPDIP